MTRTRRIYQIFGAAVACAITSFTVTARADITLQYQYVQLIGNFNANALATNGWIGVKIIAIADANSGTVASFDLASGSFGIYASAIHQVTKLSDPGSTGVWTTSALTLQGNTPANTSSNLIDSFFDNFTGKGFTGTASLSENSNMNSGFPFGATANPPHNHSPLSEAVTTGDGPGFAVLGQGPGDPNTTGSIVNNFGVGTQLTGAGSFTANQSATQNIAFVIIPDGQRPPTTPPPGSVYPPFVRGDFTDAHGTVFHVDTVPEPASLSALALGSLLLLARRRKNQMHTKPS